jgi:hypothetical protein
MLAGNGPRWSRSAGSHLLTPDQPDSPCLFIAACGPESRKRTTGLEPATFGLGSRPPDSALAHG